MSNSRIKKTTVIIFIRAARVRSKFQNMSQQKIRRMSGNFTVCDVQAEYIEQLFAILSEQLKGEYQFHLFHEPEKLKRFLEENGAEVLLVAEEYRHLIRNPQYAEKTFLLTDTEEEKRKSGETSVFRYQSAEKILEKLQTEIRKIPVQKKGDEKLRDDVQLRGLIGVYSPIHRIGKTRFSMRIGRKLSEQIPVLYLNLEGYSGGSFYYPERLQQDLGDLIYCMKQERADYGLKISSMTGQSGQMDYIMPMENETDLRAVRRDEWLSLFEQILDKCIYEAVVLDLGDCIDGLYDILQRCSRVYTPYIRENAAVAKLDQYEKNLRTAGYGDILKRTVKIQMQKKRHQSDRTEAIQ